MPAKLVKLYPHPDRRDGIPREGEWFTAEDARRLVGNGSAVRQAPPPKRSKPAARPAGEG